MEEQVARRVEEIVLAIHRRNGGTLEQLPWDAPLLARELRLDSLDLAEVMAAVEKEFGVSPFDQERPPRTWRELVTCILQARKE